MGFLIAVGFLKPKPFFHHALDQIAVVAFANVKFEGFLVFFDIELPVETVRVVDEEEKLSIFLHFRLDGTHTILQLDGFLDYLAP